MRSNLVDYHAHTVLCQHAVGTVDEYLENAQRAGLAEFGFAEHSYWMARKPGDRRLCPTKEEMHTYLQWMDDRRDKWDGKDGRPKLRVGIEADWIPSRLDEAKAFIDGYPFDYVIGSVHHLQAPADDSWMLVWEFDEELKPRMLDRYFAEVTNLAESGLCDILGHIDVIRRGPALPNVQMIADAIGPYIDRIARSGVAAEINTSGIDNELGAWQPCPPVLSMLIEAGVPITLGSDSHAASHVGRYFAEAIDYLKKCGGKEIVRFEGRKRYTVEID